MKVGVLSPTDAVASSGEGGAREANGESGPLGLPSGKTKNAGTEASATQVRVPFGNGHAVGLTNKSPSMWPKWLSREQTAALCCIAEAAIHMSLAGMGRPLPRRAL